MNRGYVNRNATRNFEFKPTSVVVPVLNQIEYTKKFVESFYKMTPADCEYELLFIDNASTDGTAEYFKELKEKDPKVTIVTHKKNYGVSASWNKGIKKAKHDVLCIVNNDIQILSFDWLTEMQKALYKVPNRYYVSPKTCYDLKKPVALRACHYEQLRYNESDNSLQNYVVGCCFMIPRIAFDEIGLFDEKFEIRYYEDLDFINRVFEAGKNVAICPSVLIYHAVGVTSRITDGGDNNQSYYHKKWGDSPHNILTKQPAKIKAVKHFW